MYDGNEMKIENKKRQEKLRKDQILLILWQAQENGK